MKSPRLATILVIAGILGGAGLAFAAPPAGRLATTPIWTVDDAPYYPYAALLGMSVAGAGDFNGDGYHDVVVGAPGSSLGCCQPGAVLVFYGSAVGPGIDPGWFVFGPHDLDGYGSGVASAGDVNGDGYDDLIFTGTFDTQPLRVLVYHGSSTGLRSAPARSLTFSPSGTSWPSPATSAGDVNGDTYSDVLVGTKTEARLYLGQGPGPLPIALTPAWTAPLQPVLTSYSSYGEVSAAGDVNADGFDDVLVGSAGCSNGQTGEGCVALYLGSAAGLSPVPVWTIESDQGSAYLGCSVAGTGDVNSDGYGDVVVGSCTSRGAAFVFLGSPTGPSTTAAWSVQGEDSSAQFGRAVRAAGDVNGDGRGDVIVGAPNVGFPYYGKAHLFLGVPAESTGPAGTVPDRTSPQNAPLLLHRDPDGSLTLMWDSSCVGTEMDWEVYEGALGSFESHSPVLCSTSGQPAARISPGDGGRYYLVVPRTLDSEGSYGTTSAGVERPPAAGACLPRSIASCP